MKTDWQTEVPTYSEIVRNNGTLGTQEKKESLMTSPFRKAPSIENDSISLLSSTECESSSTMGFSGHTWSWELGTDDRHVEAAEVTRPMEGNWFPKESYARIVYQERLTWDDEFYYYIERGADTYARYFRLYLAGYLLEEKVIYGSSCSGFVEVPDWIRTDYYFITLEITYGGYVEHGWKLRYWTLMDPDSEGYFQPVRTPYQQFRKKGYSELEFRVPMGPITKLNIETLNCHDYYTRHLYVYVDGVLKDTLYSPGSYEVTIANFANPGMHDLKLVLHWGDKFTGSYPKSIKQLYVSHKYRTVEADSMEGHSQPQDVFDYIEAYYRTHDYRRVHFVPDDLHIPHQDVIDEHEWDSLYNTYASGECKTNPRWTWGLYCHELYWTVADSYPWGLGEVGGKKYVVADHLSYDPWPPHMLEKQTWITMHEYGHTEAMTDHTGYKTDCYAEKQYGFDYMDWATPHYASSSWTSHLSWVCGWW